MSRTRRASRAEDLSSPGGRRRTLDGGRGEGRTGGRSLTARLFVPEMEARLTVRPSLRGVFANGKRVSGCADEGERGSVPRVLFPVCLCRARTPASAGDSGPSLRAFRETLDSPTHRARHQEPLSCLFWTDGVAFRVRLVRLLSSPVPLCLLTFPCIAPPCSGSARGWKGAASSPDQHFIFLANKRSAGFGQLLRYEGAAGYWRWR